MSLNPETYWRTDASYNDEPETVLPFLETPVPDTWGFHEIEPEVD